MKTMLLVPLGFAACLAACSVYIRHDEGGSDVPPDYVRVDVTADLWSALGLGECSSGLRAGDLGASLSIGGHDPSELVVDRESGQISGSADHVATSTVRPYLLTLTTRASDDERHYPVAHVIGSLDLCAAVADPVVLSITADGTSSFLVATPAALQALPGDPDRDECGGIPSCSHGINEALMWGKCTIVKGGPSPLDADADGESDIVEACNGTLTIPEPEPDPQE